MPPELWDLVKSYGMASPLVGFLLWWGFGERGDRKDSQAALVKVLTDQLHVARERVAVDQTGNQVIAALVGKLAGKDAP